MIEATDKALLDALDDAGGHSMKILAIVWTWLEQRLGDLIALKTKPHAIREQAMTLPAFATWNAGERRKLEADALLGAARLLVRIHRRLTEMETFALPARGFDGTAVVIVWKTPALANWTIDVDAEGPYAKGSPASVEPSSMAALAPRLAVCPREVRSVELSVKSPPLHIEGWRAAWDRLQQGLAAHAHNADERKRLGEEGKLLFVHLDALGDAGKSGWKVDPNPSLYVGRFDEDEIDAEDERRCAEDAARAVEAASGGPAVLVMPELVATSRIERKIVETLRAQTHAPALTVVGLYHREAPADELAVDDPSGHPLARHVNEAVVLGPDGSEMWRHRKLTTAMDTSSALPGHAGPAEDIRPGRALTIVPSPLGMVAVIVCLDCFADEHRDRVARSGADVLLVPSLSPHVKRHRTSLQQLVQTLWGIAFVCNRPFADSKPVSGEGPEHAPDPSDSRSFWAIQRRDACSGPTCARSPSCVVFRPDRPCADPGPLKSHSSMLDREEEAF